MTQAEMAKELREIFTLSEAIICSALPRPRGDATVFEIAMRDFVTGAARITARDMLCEFYGV